MAIMTAVVNGGGRFQIEPVLVVKEHGSRLVSGCLHHRLEHSCRGLGFGLGGAAGGRPLAGPSASPRGTQQRRLNTTRISFN